MTSAFLVPISCLLVSGLLLYLISFYQKKRKTILLLDIFFLIFLWNSFDTGWWFEFRWADREAKDLLHPIYMLSAVPTLILFFAYIFIKEISIGPVCTWRKIKFPVFLRKKKEFYYFFIYTGLAVLVVIPVGYGTGFITWNPDWRLERMPSRLLEYILFVGLVEETVFRGIVQNTLKNFLNTNLAAILLANLLFAFIYTHVAIPKPVNWEYVAFAFLLGLFYGGVYHHTNNIWAASCLHGIVDFLWVSLFRGIG